MTPPVACVATCGVSAIPVNIVVPEGDDTLIEASGSVTGAAFVADTVIRGVYVPAGTPDIASSSVVPDAMPK